MQPMTLGCKIDTSTSSAIFCPARARKQAGLLHTRLADTGSVMAKVRKEAPSTNRAWVMARADAEACRRCDLWRAATQTVFGAGPIGARIMFVGEQPGDVEDRAGEPFVGPAGHLLREALDEAGIDLADV